MVTQSGLYLLNDVETHGEGIILYDTARGPEEYFILENRWRGRSYDAGVERLGQGIPANGLAVWRVIESPVLFNRTLARRVWWD